MSLLLAAVFSYRKKFDPPPYRQYLLVDPPFFEAYFLLIHPLIFPTHPTKVFMNTPLDYKNFAIAVVYY